MGILENYFVPEYAYIQNPKSAEQKYENCKFLFELIEDAGLQVPNCQPDGKPIVLFGSIFTKRNIHFGKRVP
jgi:hypothetical protein